MPVTHLVSTKGFTVSDLVRFAAEHSLGMEPVDVSPRLMETPVFSGRVLAHDVQPGLTATASDITYMTDRELAADWEPALSCSVLLRGREETITADGYGPVTRAFERAVLLGFSETTRFRYDAVPARESCSAGFMLKADFFDRFGEHISDDGLAALQEFASGAFHVQSLPRSPRIVELGRRCLEHPYNGQLGELFLESNTLSLVVEVAELLNQERQMVALLGRRHYDRVMETRDILDASLAAPPRTLELARRVGVNLTTLQANFKVVFGTTIFGYVRAQRLLMARVLLRDHDLSVAAAGYRVGFASPAAFTAAYRRHFGHPPGRDLPRDRAPPLFFDGF